MPYVEHQLTDVLIIVMSGILCGLDELQDIAAYGKSNATFFRETFGIERTPSKSTLTRIMNLIDGEAAAAIIVNIMREAIGVSGDAIAFDGKTIRATAKGNREKLHIMTAYMTQTGVVLGQKAVNEKTNEIPVMQEMLKHISVKNKIITADAMHCQKATAAQAIKGEGGYIFGLKGNQEILNDETRLYLDGRIASDAVAVETAQTKEKNGGRIETRTCYKTPSMEWLEDRGKWAGLSCSFAIDRVVETPAGASAERSCYITSLTASAEELLRLTREHWGVESMRYQLDVTFSEDGCRIISSNGQYSFNIFRKLALAFHKKYIGKLTAKTKPSVKNNMFQALLSTDLLVKILDVAFVSA